MGKALSVLLLAIAAAVTYVWLRTEPPAPEERPGVAGSHIHAGPEGAETAGPPARSDPMAPGRPAPDAGASAPLEFEVNSEADLMLAMRELDIEDLENRMAQWGIRHGYPQFDFLGNYVLDQPYQQYDDETLRALAESEDMWAQQILADKLADERPAEAIEWYRRAGVNGSSYAMLELARLYHRIARSGDTSLASDGEELEQRYALRDAASPGVAAYAWLAVSERSGWDPARGPSLMTQVSRELSDEQIAEACELADALHSDVLAERQARALPPLDLSPPPVVYSPADLQGATQCYRGAGSSIYDLSGCREVIVHTGEMSSSVWVCADGTQ